MMDDASFDDFDSEPPNPLADSPVFAKYREASIGGFQAVPDILLKKQKELELSPTDLVVLLNILMHWWYPDQKPFPRSNTIAKRTGLHIRSVQRAIRNMEEMKLLERQKNTNGATFLDPTPLVEKLCALVKNDPDYEHRSRARNGEEAAGSNQPPL